MGLVGSEEFMSHKTELTPIINLLLGRWTSISQLFLEWTEGYQGTTRWGPPRLLVEEDPGNKEVGKEKKSTGTAWSSDLKAVIVKNCSWVNSKVALNIEIMRKIPSHFRIPQSLLGLTDTNFHDEGEIKRPCVRSVFPSFFRYGTNHLTKCFRIWPNNSPTNS